MSVKKSATRAWIVSVNMGYGHERAAFGLEDLAYGGIVTANQYHGIPDKDKKMWTQSRSIYELVSRLQPLPVIGQSVFNVMDHFQRVPPFYPRRDLSASTLQLREIYRLIESKGLGKHLIEKLSVKRHLPFVSTFFIPAFAAEVHGYPGDIYIVVCDADMSRAWAPLDPKKSRIKYFAPTGRVVERLKLYGVREENIFLTGFPLPKSTIGGPEGHIIKQDLMERLCLLDPNGIFCGKYRDTLTSALGPGACQLHPGRKITLTFCVGGAGAQKQLGVDILTSLRKPLLAREIMLNLEAGTRKPIAQFFQQHIKRLRLQSVVGDTLHIHYYKDRPAYFRSFAKTIRKTDILWTKPSELSFYTGLGIPIIIAPPIGSQEDFNKKWLQAVSGGIPQNDPRYANEWLVDWIQSGGLAHTAWNGYIEAPTHGTYRIESLLAGAPTPISPLPLIV